MILCKFGSLLIGNFSTELGKYLLNFHVTFVADNNETHLRVAIHFGFVEPPGYVVERLAIRDIVD